jgi:hypothetical protein
MSNATTRTTCLIGDVIPGAYRLNGLPNTSVNSKDNT